MKTIKIEQWPTAIQAKNTSILDAALSAGIPFPHECRSGVCGSCKCRLKSGDVDLGQYAPQALGDDERAAGMILACRAIPKTDIGIAWEEESAIAVAAMLPVRRAKARVVELEHLASKVSIVRLKMDGEPLAFLAGQFARLRFDSIAPRSYSMANRPDEKLLEFHIRHVPNGSASSYVANELIEREIVQLEGPFGSAYLRENHGGRIVAVAGGTGLAPIMSIVRTALESMPAPRIHLYFGVRNESDIYFEDVLMGLASKHSQFTYDIVLSEPGNGSTRRSGRLNEVLHQDFSSLANVPLYVAGSLAMTESVTMTAMELGSRKEDIHRDTFVASGGEEPEKPDGFLSRLFRRIVGYNETA